MRFLTPAETRLLEELPADEAAILGDFFGLLDARLVTGRAGDAARSGLDGVAVEETAPAGGKAETPPVRAPTLFDEEARP